MTSERAHHREKPNKGERASMAEHPITTKRVIHDEKPMR